jgi:hypothetical protein
LGLRHKNKSYRGLSNAGIKIAQKAGCVANPYEDRLPAFCERISLLSQSPNQTFSEVGKSSCPNPSRRRRRPFLDWLVANGPPADRFLHSTLFRSSKPPSPTERSYSQSGAAHARKPGKSFRPRLMNNFGPTIRTTTIVILRSTDNFVDPRLTLPKIISI